MYALGGWYCRLCQVGEFCFNNTNRTCPDHSSSFGVAKTYSDCYCNAGYKNTTARTEASFCEDCPANSFCTGKGSVQACTANAVAPVQSASYLRCYCDWGWKGVNNSACVGCQSPTFCYGGVEAQCSEGTYSGALSWNRLNCSCIPGRWGPAGGPCILCGAGKYNLIPGCKACSNTSDVDCELCGLGTASSVLGRNSTCDVCGAGKFSSPANQRGAFTCENCAAGTISGGIGASNCTSCESGYFAVSGSSACTPCPAGTFATGLVGSCTACGAGKYSLEGVTACSYCLAGKYGTMLGSPSSGNCLDCGYGKYNPVQGADDPSDCLSCASGTYTGVNGTTNCSECGVGSFAVTEASVCSLCSPGTFAAARASSCGVCPPGLFSTPDSPICLACAPGEYNDRNASANCSLCEAGRYATGGTSGCLTCTYGTYSSGSGFWYCNECDNGRFTGDGSSAVRFISCFASVSPALTCFARSARPVSRGHGGSDGSRRTRTAAGAARGSTRRLSGRAVTPSARRARRASSPTRHGRGRSVLFCVFFSFIACSIPARSSRPGFAATPRPVFLGDPLHPIVVLHGPAVHGHVVRDFDDGELGKRARGLIETHFLDNLDENRVVAPDILVHVPVGGPRDVLGCSFVLVFRRFRQAEPPVAPVEQDFSGHVDREWGVNRVDSSESSAFLVLGSVFLCIPVATTVIVLLFLVRLVRLGVPAVRGAARFRSRRTGG